MQTTGQKLINQGMQQGMKHVAAKMLESNMSIASIAQYTGLLPEEIQAMSKELLV